MTARREREEVFMREMLHAAIDSPAPGLAERVMAAVRQSADVRREGPSHWIFGLVAVVLAGALVLTLAYGVRPASRSTVPGANEVGVAAMPTVVGGARLFFDSPTAGWLAQELARGSGPPSTTIYQTVNGGGTWTQRLTYDGGLPSQVLVGASGAGLVVGGQRDAGAAELVLFLTADGGRTWRRAPVPPGVVAWGVPYFLDAARGWVLGSLGPDQAEILSTADGGLTWSASAPFNDRANFPGLSSVRLRILWAAGGRGVVVPPSGPGTAPPVVTEDGGATWLRSAFAGGPPAGAGSATVGVGLLPDGSGLLLQQAVDARGRNGALFARVTSDGGAHWGDPVRLDGPAPAGVARVLFVLDRARWLVSTGSGGDLLATDDGGRTVRRYPHVLPGGYVFQSMGFSGPADGWAIATSGARRAAFVSHDGGATWQAVPPPP